MKINKNVFNNVLLIISLIGLSNEIYSQSTDIWSGTFILKSSESIPLDSIKIEKTIDVKKDDVASKYESDVNRWILTSKNNNYEDGITVRRFLFDLEDNRNEYEQFGWTEMYLKEEMRCIDAGHFFICQTTPDSEVKVEDESFYTKTGIFGIRLHYGLFELEKYN